MMKAVVGVMWTPEILESGKGKEIDSPLELSERTHSCWPILGLWPPKL